MSGVLTFASSQISTPQISAPSIQPTGNFAVSGAISDVGLSNTTVPPIWTNASFAGNCWAQWTDYWDNMEPSMSSIITTETITSTFATASTYYVTTSGPLTTSVTTETYYETGSEANHNAFATFTIKETQTVTLGGESSIPTSTAPTTYSTLTEATTWQVDEYVTRQPKTPNCTLPSIVPQCQSEWSQWLSAGAVATRRPACPQASVDPDQCSTAISAFYASVPVHGYEGVPAWLTDGTSTFWPATMSFAPSCTLGCQQCAITGNNVRLLYWPASTTTTVENGSSTASRMRSLTNGTRIRTAMFDGTALTSPTLYISYDTLYASNSCHGIGRTIKNTIVPVASNHLSSLAYQPLANWAIGPGQWGNGELSYKYISRPFNLTDLVEPIPDSIFNQLPFCQRELRGWKSAGFNESGFTCSPRDAPYAPLIAIPTEVRDLDPAWASCTAWYGGLFDPPVALQGVAAAATPTVPAAVQTTPASARSTLSAGFPAETGGAYQPATSFQNADPTGTPILTSESMPTAGAAPHGSQTGEFVASTSMIEAGLDPATVQLSNSASFTDSNAELSSTTAADPAGSVAPGVAGVVASIIGASKGIDDDTSATNLAESASRSQTTTNALSVLLAAATTTLAASELPVVVLPSPAVQVTGYDPQPSGSSSSVTYTVPIPNPTPDVTGSQIPASMVFEADGQTYTAYQPTFNTGGIEIAESTTTVVLESGSHMSAGTQTLSNIGGGSFVAGQTTLAFPSTTGEADPPESTSSGIIYPALSTGFIGGLTLTGQPYPSGLILENTATSITLSAQGPAVMIGTDSVGAAGFGAMVLDGSTYQVVPSATSSSSERAGLAFQSAKALTVAGQIFTAVSIAGGVELLHGTASATLVADRSVAAIGTAVVSVDVDGQLEVASSTPTLPQVDQGLQLLTLGSAVVTATPVAGRPDVAEIGGYTLSVGGPARIISGQLVSEGIGGLVVSATVILGPSWTTAPVVATTSDVSKSSVPGASPSSSEAGVGRVWPCLGAMGVMLAISVMRIQL